MKEVIFCILGLLFLYHYCIPPSQEEIAKAQKEMHEQTVNDIRERMIRQCGEGNYFIKPVDWMTIPSYEYGCKK